MYETISNISEENKSLIKKINKIDYKDFDKENLALEISKVRKVLLENSHSPEKTISEDPQSSIKVFALVKEAFRRQLDINIFDEQLHAGLVLCEGAVVEMQTGEGKTFAGVFPAALNAFSGIHTDIYTVNDYLAKRDALWLSPVYSALSISVSHIYEEQNISARNDSYKADVTYMTARESGFDYLREFTVESPTELFERKFEFAIVDEADSILIDEARIPLVIAESTTVTHEKSLQLISDLASKMNNDEHYSVDSQENNVYLTEDGIIFAEKELNVTNLYSDETMDLLVGINNALFAKELVKIDVDYIVKNKKIHLVDEFTGRVAQKRHWPNGLHEAIEIKEGLNPSDKGRILAQITLQNYMRLYSVISGMTGTAAQAAEELDNTYDLKVHIIPTHKEKIRLDNEDRIYYDKNSKLKSILQLVKQAHDMKRPVLIGTGSVEESEEISKNLDAANINCNVLNARNDEMEAKLISEAGDLNAVTVSTNMAGRGIDIKLGGPEETNYEKVTTLGGLLVIGTNRHESMRVDSQLRGRAGRQGDPGESQFFISIEDEIFKKFNFSDLVPQRLLRKNKTGLITNERILKEALRLQRIVSGMNFDIRSSLSKYTVMLHEQCEFIREFRRKILLSNLDFSPFMEKSFPDKFQSLVLSYGKEHVCDAEKLIILRIMNNEWAEYLDNMSYVKDSIHIMKMSGKDPLFEYNKILFESFKELQLNIEEKILDTLKIAKIDKDGADTASLGLNKPVSTWTYIVSNNSEQLSLFPFLDSLAKRIKNAF